MRRLTALGDTLRLRSAADRDMPAEFAHGRIGLGRAGGLRRRTQNESGTVLPPSPSDVHTLRAAPRHSMDRLAGESPMPSRTGQNTRTKLSSPPVRS